MTRDLQRSKPRRVLLVAGTFAPLESPGSKRVSKFAQYLPDYGWEPYVLTTDLAFDDAMVARNPPPLNDDRIFRVRDRMFNKVKSGYVSSRDARQLTLKHRILRRIKQFAVMPDRDAFWVKPAVARAMQEHAKTPFHAVLSTSPGPSCHVAASRIAAACGIPHVCDYRDLWTANHIYQQPGLRAWIERNWEKQILNTCTAVSVISPSMGERLAAQFPSVRDKLHIIYNGYDPADFPPPSPAPEQSSTRTLVYAGSFYEMQRDPRPIFRAMASVAKKRQLTPADLQFVIYGPREADVLEAAETLGVGEFVSHRGSLPYTDLLRQLSHSDLQVVLTFTGEAGKLEMTTKFFDYLGTGSDILLLADKDSDLARSASGIKGVQTVEHGDMPALEAVLERLLDEGTQAPDNGGTADADGRDQFWRSTQAGKLANILGSIVSKEEIDA